MRRFEKGKQYARSLSAHLPRIRALESSSLARSRTLMVVHDRPREATAMVSKLWHEAPIVALDLEGSGAQDHDVQAILEIAAVPLRNGRPDLTQALTSLINPGREIRQHRWLSPGLTNAVLASAPPLDSVEPQLAELINGRWLVGHNVHVDWGLLRRRVPALRPAGLIDTLSLARALGEPNRSLSVLVERLHLTEVVNASAVRSQPHRALWDTVAVAHLLPCLIDRLWPGQPPTLETLRLSAGIPLGAEPSGQTSLFD